MSRQIRRAAERAARKNSPPLLGPSGHVAQARATAFQSAMQQVQVADTMLTQWNLLNASLSDEDREEFEILENCEAQLKRRLQLARIAAIDAGAALIGMPPTGESVIEEATDADVAAINAEKLRQLDAEEARP